MDLSSAPQVYQAASSSLSKGYSQPPGGPPGPHVTTQREGAAAPLPPLVQNQLPVFLASAQPHQPAQPQQHQHQHQGFGTHQGIQLSQQPSAQSHLPGHQPIIFNMQHLHTQPHLQPQTQPQPGPSRPLQAHAPPQASQPQAGLPAVSAQDSAPQEHQPAPQAASGHRERDNFGLVR